MTRQDFFYRLQAYAARAAMALFRALPLDAASWLGGRIARTFGPLTRAQKTAVENLRRAMPELDEAARRRIIGAMWDNIGRTVGEYPHLGRLMTDTQRVEIIDPAGLANKLRDDGIGALLVGMHYGNWELSTVPGFRAGMAQRHFYRAPNNPYVNDMLIRLRQAMQQEGYLAKGAEGARQAVALLRKGTHLGMLVDQKQDEGIAAPFFGRDAMTTTAPAALARRVGVPIAAAQVVRLKGAKFRIFVHEFDVAKTADREADVIVTTKQINTRLESWVRDHPEQWFWVHRRWPKTVDSRQSSVVS
jgi:KDO2-lipid IV(A) lauroyltransferase